MTRMGACDRPESAVLFDQLKHLTRHDKPVALDVCRALASVIPSIQHDRLISALLTTDYESPAHTVSCLKMVFCFLESRTESSANFLAEFLEFRLIPVLTSELSCHVLDDVVILCNLTVQLHGCLFPIYRRFCYNRLSGHTPSAAIRLVTHHPCNHPDLDEFIEIIFALGLDRALAEPNQVAFTRFLLPGLCPVANPRPNLAKILHQRLQKCLSNPISDPTSILRLLVRFSSVISQSLDVADRDAWQLQIQKLCLDCLSSPKALHCKASLYLLETCSPALWSDYARCWEALKSQSVVELIRAWAAIGALLTQPSNWPWVMALFSYALNLAKLRPEIVQWILSQQNFPSKFACDFVSKILMPLACQQSWIRSIRGKLKGVHGNEKLNVDLIAFVDKVYKAEDMEDRIGFLHDIVVNVFVRQELGAYGSFVAPLLEFVAKQEPESRLWVDDVIIQRFRRSASLAYTPSIRLREQIAMAQIIRRFADFRKITVAALSSWLGVIQADVARSFQIDDLDWIETHCSAHCLQYLLDRSHPDSDAVPVARIFNLLHDDNAQYAFIIKSCLDCICDSCRRPYVALMFCPLRSIALISALILNSPFQSRLGNALSTFMGERSDDLVASLLALQPSVKSSLTIFQHLFVLFPSDPMLLACVQRCRDSIEVLLMSPSEPASLDLLYQYFTSMELSQSAPKLDFSLVAWLFNCPDSIDMAIKCLARALHLGSTLPDVPNLFDVISHVVVSTFDVSLCDVFRIIQSLLPMLQSQQQEILVKDCVDSFLAVPSTVQDAIAREFLPIFIPEKLCTSVEFNKMVSIQLNRLLGLPYRHLCILVDHFCPVWIKNNSIARIFFSQIVSLSIIEDADAPTDDASPKADHVRCSLLTMYSVLSDSTLIDALIQRHLNELNVIQKNPNARFPSSIGARSAVLHAQSIGFLIKSCSYDSLSRFISGLWDLLYQGLAPNARQSLEAAMIRLLISFPEVICNDCSVRLATFPFRPKNRPTIEASAVAIVSIAILSLPPDALLESTRKLIADSLTKRCSSNAGLVRTCSQYYIVKLTDHWGQQYPISDFATTFVEHLICSPEFIDLSRRLGPKFEEFAPLKFTSLECSRFPQSVVESMANAVSELLTDIKFNEDDYQETANRKFTRPCKASISVEQALLSIQNSAAKDYQKKIEPLQKYYEDFDLQKMHRDVLEQNYRSSNRTSTPFPLILIASLVHKPTNLGGLARTAEIFGCQSLIVHDLRIKNDPKFTTLSVTAQDWLDIQECHDEKLESYLSSLKSDGYTIVGLEQTAQSVSLEKMVFPNRCALLLGTEKTGIPPSLLHFVDTCVEIPQRGVIRSLNVHVSAAICVWQYAVQQMYLSNNASC